MTAPPDLALFIDGEWRESESGRSFEKLNPWDGSVVARAAAADASDARTAIEAASAVASQWAQSSPRLRQEIFLRAASILESRAGDVLAWLAEETGCGSAFGTMQVDFALSLLRQASGAGYQSVGQIIPSDHPGGMAMAIRRPVGVVASIAPWNAALILSGRGILAPIALGNSVVLKPSEESPYVGGLLWAEIFAEAGLPPGVLNVVTHAAGEASPIGEEIVTNRAVRRINFTGSTATGRRLAEAAGRNLKRVVLELGGQNPLIVLRDADLEYAVEAAAYGSFLNQGQICMCARRLYVEKPVADEFLERFAVKARSLVVGDPKDDRTVIGPLINPYALQMVHRRVTDAVDQGASVLAGGSPVGPCYPPTLLVDVPQGCELETSETFGPVAVVDVVEDAEEAVLRANSSPYGLTAGVLTENPELGMAIAERLEAGIVHVKDQPINDEPQMPFGGVKDSGWGRFGVAYAAEEFTELQWLTVKRQGREFPF
jgi:acyl-CoA reductase-like NAD-dependent aldehyde dehydrogenase